MKPHNRRKKITELVKAKNSIRLEDLTKIFNVSKMTLYRDIKLLDDSFFVSKGSLNYKSGNSFTEAPYFLRKEKNKELKMTVAHTAINYINNNDTIFLDGSSTVGYLVDEIIKKTFNLTIVTISPIISIKLAKSNNIKILCPGGLLDNINFIYNCEIEDFLKTININKAFMSCGAFSIENGFTDLSIGEYKIKETIVNKIPEVNILVDHSKINNTYSYTWSNYDSITRLICDNKIDKNNLNDLKSRKPEVILGEVEIFVNVHGLKNNF